MKETWGQFSEEEVSEAQGMAGRVGHYSPFLWPVSSGTEGHVEDDTEVCSIILNIYLMTGSHILARLTLNSADSPGLPPTPGDAPVFVSGLGLQVWASMSNILWSSTTIMSQMDAMRWILPTPSNITLKPQPPWFLTMGVVFERRLSAIKMRSLV